MFTIFIWDFDGTLFDSYPAMTEAFYRLLKDYNIEENKEDIYFQLKISLGSAVNYFKEKHNINKSKKEIIEKFRKLERILAEDLMKPLPHALDICKQIYFTGGTNFLLTHRDFYISHMLMNKYGFNEYFKDVVTRENNFKRKPDGEAFQYLKDKYNLNINDTICIGDRDIDALAAKMAGFKTCFITDGVATCTTDVDYKIQSLNELLEYIG